MAARRFDVGMLSIIITILACFCVNSLQDDCIQAPYKAYNQNTDVFLEDLELLDCVRVRRDVANQTVLNSTTLAPPTINTTPSQSTTNTTKLDSTTEKIQKNNTPAPRVELNIPHLLGENGTGIRRYKECSNNATSNISSSTPICVSEPIVPEEVNSTLNGFNMDEFTEPQDKLLADNNITHIKNDTHEYYNSTFITEKELFDEHWNSLMKSGEIKINHVLSASHRRAATIPLRFDFPFYGQPVKNVTIATGGFLYTGSYLHSWLAATQYIAPLMANFDTSFYNNSFVKFIDNGTALTVIWENVVLQDKPSDGNFTFAATLYKNGDMAFTYKTIPIPIESILDAFHPVKVGLSDAFILDQINLFVRRKTIYEYHRIEFRNQHIITNNTIMKLTALPSCPQYKTCKSCLEHDTVFECTWCSRVKRCSAGNDRQRQEWLYRNCAGANITNIAQCPAEENIMFNTDVGDHNSPSYTTSKNVTFLDPVHAASVEVSTKNNGNEESGGSAGAIVAGLVALITAGGIVTWFLYAYRNPHTNSGQFLVKYRPSQWSWRRGEARYTAATIHM